MSSEGLIEPSYFTNHGYHRDTLARVEAAFSPSQQSVLRSLALVLVKPDAFASGKAEGVIDFLIGRGLVPVYSRPYLLPRLSAFEQLYLYNLSVANPLNMAGNWWLNSQVYLMGPSFLLLMASTEPTPPSVHQRLADLKGASDPLQAAPGSLRRCLHATNRSLNLIHTADDPLSTAREFAALFGWESLGRVLCDLNGAGSARSRQREWSPTLDSTIADGLELCRAAKCDLSFCRVLCRIKLLLTYVGGDEPPENVVRRLRQLYASARTEEISSPEHEVEALLALLANERTVVAEIDTTRCPSARWLELLAGAALVEPERGVELLGFLRAAGARIMPWDEIVFLTGLLHWKS